MSMAEVEIVPTIVPASFAELQAGVARYGAFAPAIHIDAVDGVFAPHATWMPGERLPDTDRITYEAHLMVAHPQEAGALFIQAGVSRLIVHIESFADIPAARSAFDAWQRGGIGTGIALLLTTPLEALAPVASAVQSVHLMSIGSIGAQGETFDERALPRIADIRARYPDLTVSIDGGINEENAERVAAAGATRLCVGSALSRAADPAAVYKRLLERARAGTMSA